MGRKMVDLRLSPQYDSDGKQVLSMTVYQIRNRKYQGKGLRKRKNGKRGGGTRMDERESQRVREDRKLEKWRIRRQKKRRQKVGGVILIMISMFIFAVNSIEHQFKFLITQPN